MTAPLRVAQFLIERLRHFQPHKWQQAKRPRPLLGDAFVPELALFNEYSLFRVPDDACLGLLHWACGRYEGVLWEDVPSWQDVLAAQARATRPVSMVTIVPPEAQQVAGIPKKYFEHDLPLAFALHDLRHLHKFFEQTFFAGQHAFFKGLHDALGTATWALATEGASAEFHKEIQRIAADMNGAAPFLGMALKAAMRKEFPQDSERRWNLLPRHLVEVI